MSKKWDCSGMTIGGLGLMSPPYGNRIGRSSLATKAIYHCCEHCGEAVSAAPNGWHHIRQPSTCTKFSVNPIVSISRTPFMKPVVDREAEWAQERAELQFEYEQRCIRIIAELGELYDRVRTSNDIVISLDRCEAIETLIKEFS